MNPHDSAPPARNRHAHRAGVLLALAVLLAFAPATASADKVFYKNGKVIEGIVEKEYEQRIEFLFQGRIIVIPRERIDRIERGEGMENLDLLMQKLREAIDGEDTSQAKALLGQAAELAPPGAYTDRLNELKKDLERLETMGSAVERRKRAETLLAQASERFDRIENKEGIELLFRALTQDPQFDAAHELMARYMKEQTVHNLPVESAYFERFVDPETVKFNHPIILQLPEIFVDEVQHLQNADEPEQIELRVRRLDKITEAMKVHPDWLARAGENQRKLLDLGSVGIVAREAEKLFAEGEYRKAEMYVKALGDPTGRPAVAELYTRVYIGSGRLEEAIALLQKSKEEGGAMAARADEYVNVLQLYGQVKQAEEKGENREARSLLQRIFEQRDRYRDSPEIYRLVADAKASYDVTAMDTLAGAGEVAQAADLAAQVAEYSVDPKMRAQAIETFAKLAPQLPFRLEPKWILDGLDLPCPPRSAELMKVFLTSGGGMKFDDASPFTLEVKLRQGTEGEGGKALAVSAGLDTSQMFASGVRVLVLKLGIDFAVVHKTTGATIYQLSRDFTALADDIRAGREAIGDTRHQTGLVVFSDLGSIEDLDRFIEADFPRYLPVADLANLPKEMKVDKKN